MIRRIKSQDKGVKYTHFRSEQPVDGVCALGESKVVIHGKPKITIMENSYKYGPQIQFSVICPKNILKQQGRNYSDWNVVEINVSFSEGKEMIRQAYLELFKGKQMDLF